MPEWRNGRRRGLKILRSQDHAGSSPALGTIAPLAQLVEHQAFNLLVVGSNPTGCTRIYERNHIDIMKLIETVVVGGAFIAVIFTIKKKNKRIANLLEIMELHEKVDKINEEIIMNFEFYKLVDKFERDD